MSHSILEIQWFMVYGDFSEHVLVLKALMEEIYFDYFPKNQSIHFWQVLIIKKI